jgi:hypothetical protein
MYYVYYIHILFFIAYSALSYIRRASFAVLYYIPILILCIYLGTKAQTCKQLLPTNILHNKYLLKRSSTLVISMCTHHKFYITHVYIHNIGTDTQGNHDFRRVSTLIKDVENTSSSSEVLMNFLH